MRLIHQVFKELRFFSAHLLEIPSIEIPALRILFHQVSILKKNKRALQLKRANLAPYENQIGHNKGKHSK